MKLFSIGNSEKKPVQSVQISKSVSQLNASNLENLEIAVNSTIKPQSDELKLVTKIAYEDSGPLRRGSVKLLIIKVIKEGIENIQIVDINKPQLHVLIKDAFLAAKKEVLYKPETLKRLLKK